MPNELFLQVLNMSFTASFVILAVLVARLLLNKNSHVISYALWAVVLFRLVCPFSFESAISLLPVQTTPIPPEIMYQQTPQINTGIPFINDSVNAILPAATPYASMNPMQGVIAIGTFLWICGIAVLLVYSVASLWKLKRKLRGAVCAGGNVYLAEGLASPFVMGLFFPKIYLPAHLTEEEKRYIILHEQTHIKRLDHLVKIVSFAVLCLHWFNPLVWAAFFLCGKDMEMSCDEAVIKKLGAEVKKDYSSSLLMLATGRRMVGGSPLAFGEGDTKSRIINVLNYKKPAFWVAAVSIIAVAAVGIGLALNPKNSDQKVDSIYTANLTIEQKAEIKTHYQLASNSDIFETKFHVSDKIKSYAYYVELYQRGTLIGTVVENYGNLDTYAGSIITAFSMNRPNSDQPENMRWMASFIDGGYSTHPAIPFPDGFIPQGVSITTLTNEGKNKEMPQIVPEQPIIIANIGMHSAANNRISSYSCDYLMENPEAIAQYECVYLVKCLFSEKDETELVKMLPSSTSVEGNTAAQETTAAAITAPIVNSYYAGQSSRAFKMLQKSIFQNWVKYDNAGHVSQNLVNPKWDLDCFSNYMILDANGNVVSGEDLYYCTFSDDNGKNGYLVMAYHGDNMEKISRVETPYAYDLRANMEEITARLAETEVDLATAVAARVQVVDAKQSSMREAILITDGNEHQYLYYFDKPDADA